MELATTDFGRRVRRSAQRAGLPALWRWWAAQLAPLVPVGLRSAAQRRRLRPTLQFDHDVAILRVPRATNGVLTYAEAARIPLSGDSSATASAGRAAVDSLARVAYGGAVAAARVAIVLPREQVLRKALTLPAMVEDSLRQTLAYDADRHTPFKAEDVYFDAVIVGRDASRREIRVDWAAALKTSVDQACSRARSWGATVVAVWPEAPDRGAALALPRLNLLPASERPDRGGWRRWQVALPGALVLALALVAVALPVWQKRNYTLALMQVTEQARLQANTSDALRQQLDQMAGDYNFALQRKYAFPSAVQVLEDVTRILPDDTWLTQFELRTPPKGKEAPHRDLLLRGESANAGRLVSLLEESKLFEQAAPRSPTTKIQPGPGEIFDLGAQIKAQAPPPTVELSTLPRIAPPAEPQSAKPEAKPAAAAAGAPVAAAPAAPSTRPAAGAAAPAIESGAPQAAADVAQEDDATPMAATPSGASAPGPAATSATASPAAGARLRGAPRPRNGGGVTQ
jgi:general secretion pathway protein L